MNVISLNDALLFYFLVKFNLAFTMIMKVYDFKRSRADWFYVQALAYIRSVDAYLSHKFVYVHSIKSQNWLIKMCKKINKHTDTMVEIWIINTKKRVTTVSFLYGDGACHNKLNRYSVSVCLADLVNDLYIIHITHILIVLFLLLFNSSFFFFFLCRRQYCCRCQCWFCFFFYSSIFKFCIHHQQWRQRQQRNISTSLSDKTILNIRVWCCHSHSFCRRLLRTFCAYTWI